MPFTAAHLTKSITPMILFRDDLQLGTATGFFLKYGGQWFLVSNWHVFSGCNNRTGQPRHSKGAVPNMAVYFSFNFNKKEAFWQRHQLELGSAFDNTAKWLEHPELGQIFDVAAIPIHSETVGKSIDLLDPEHSDPKMIVDFGGEVFLPGYPLGITSGGKMPIWKRASMASSLMFGEGLHQPAYVDTATREGMSGAPCLAIANGQYYRTKKAPEVELIQRPMSWRLIGVYSGRLNAKDDFGAQIGIVWRSDGIFDILSGQCAGKVVLRQPV